MKKSDITAITNFVLEQLRCDLMPQSVDHPDCPFCRHNWSLITKPVIKETVKEFSAKKS